MGRWRGVGRSRAIWLLLAAAIGYLIGNWNAPGADRPEPAPAVALRFQEDFAPSAAAHPLVPRTAAQAPMIFGAAQFALFEPAPIMPNGGLLQPAAAPPMMQPAARPVSTEVAELTPAVPTPATQPAAPTVSDTAIEAAKRHPTAPRLVKRPGYLFDDAQLARIKRRLHLSPDQERMWPAVAAALRNIGRQQEHEARWRGQPGALDPNSEAVQDLKSAAIPLLMSFSDEQKDEVRHLARNMGLDQLASQF